MTEILTESFCERCGTRYTFETVQARGRRFGALGTLGRGLRNFVVMDDSSFDEAMAAARSEADQRVTTAQLEAFHRTFNFCLSCRQYTCAECWNAVEGRCLTCAPLPEREVAEAVPLAIALAPAPVDAPAAPESDAATREPVAAIAAPEVEAPPAAEALPEVVAPEVEAPPATETPPEAETLTPPVATPIPAEPTPVDAAAPRLVLDSWQSELEGSPSDVELPPPDLRSPDVLSGVDSAPEAVVGANLETAPPIEIPADASIAPELGTAPVSESTPQGGVAPEVEAQPEAIAEPPEPEAFVGTRRPDVLVGTDSGAPAAVDEPTAAVEEPAAALEEPSAALEEPALAVAELTGAVAETAGQVNEPVGPQPTVALPQPVPTSPVTLPEFLPGRSLDDEIAAYELRVAALAEAPAEPLPPIVVAATPPQETQRTVHSAGQARFLAATSAPATAAAAPSTCRSCGLSLSASARFCRRCGTQQVA